MCKETLTRCQIFFTFPGIGFEEKRTLIGTVLAMAMLEFFWIANTVYLAFFLSAVVGGIAKLVAYRRGFQQW